MGTRRRLLYVLHQYGHLGGAELQTNLLARRMEGAFDVAVAWMDLKGKCAVLLNVADGSERRWATEPVVQLGGDSAAAERTLEQILAAFRPDIVHFQQVMYWPLSAIDIAVASGAKVVVSLYDYITITPDYAMIGVADPRETFTAAYAISRFGSDLSGLLAERREHFTKSLERVNRRVVISDYLRRVVSLVYPMDFQVIEPGIEPFEPAARAPGGGAVRFGFLGSFIRTKGLATLTEAFVKLRQRHPAAELRIYGGPVPRGAPPAGMYMLGPYGATDLSRIFSEFDVGVIPSIFAETYSIVLSEMWNAGVPPVVSNIGAMGERLSDGVNGRLVPPGDSDALAAAMAWFIENNSWKSWKLPAPRTADEMAGDHEAMYESLA
jgi:glycosyltransferase involved in cell wall biosynthesis